MLRKIAFIGFVSFHAAKIPFDMVKQKLKNRGKNLNSVCVTVTGISRKTNKPYIHNHVVDDKSVGKLIHSYMTTGCKIQSVIVEPITRSDQEIIG